jgi:hypothetical protein
VKFERARSFKVLPQVFELKIFELRRALPLEVLAKKPEFDVPCKVFKKVFNFEVALFKVFEGALRLKESEK